MKLGMKKIFALVAAFVPALALAAGSDGKSKKKKK